MAPPPGQPIFRMRLALDEVTPTVWRRLLVPGGIQLGRLHDVFQAAMGWTNSHLHCFTIGGGRFGPVFDDYPEDERDENEVSVLQAIGELRRFSYEYDFGDSWEHDVVVEEHVRLPRGLKHAVCVDGEHPYHEGEEPSMFVRRTGARLQRFELDVAQREARSPEPGMCELRPATPEAAERFENFARVSSTRSVPTRATRCRS